LLDALMPTLSTESCSSPHRSSEPHTPAPPRTPPSSYLHCIRASTTATFLPLHRAHSPSAAQAPAAACG
jgi:hypothetical protein